MINLPKLRETSLVDSRMAAICPLWDLLNIAPNPWLAVKISDVTYIRDYHTEWKLLANTLCAYIVALREAHLAIGLYCHSSSLMLYAASDGDHDRSKLLESHHMASFFDGCTPILHIEWNVYKSAPTMFSRIITSCVEDSRPQSFQKLYISNTAYDSVTHAQCISSVSIFPSLEHLHDPKGYCLKDNEYGSSTPPLAKFLGRDRNIHISQRNGPQRRSLRTALVACKAWGPNFETAPCMH